MVLEKSDYELEEEKEKENYDIIEKELDIKYEARHQNLLYKILKYNPIDFLNNQYRKFIDIHHMNDIECQLQWWGAYIYVKEVLRRVFNHRVENPYKLLFPEYGPGVIVSNHESHFDPFFVGASCHRQIRWMSKLENFKTPLVRTLFYNLGAFRLDRENPEEGWNIAKNLIDDGRWIGIFPEGTRTDDGSLGEFRTGAVRLAIEKKVPIVPVGVIGSRAALPKGKLVLKPVKVITRVGKPIYYDDYDIDTITYPEIRRLTDELRQEVVDLVEGNYHTEESKAQQLSIGTAKDMEEKPKGNPVVKFFKKAAFDFLQLWDDSWYALLKSLEVFGAKDYFGSFVYNFSGNIVHYLLGKTLLPYKVLDYDKYIPDKHETGAIICSNHNSEWDVIILATTFQQRGHYVFQQAKESLFRVPIVNAWVRSARAFPLTRGEHDVGSYNYCVEQLKNKEWVIIYPEGTTNQGGGELMEGHTGAMRAAIDAQVPIFLVGITGSEDVYPKKARMLNFGKGIILKAGPIFMEHKQYWGKPMPDYETLKELTVSMMAQIKELLMYDDPTA